MKQAPRRQTASRAKGTAALLLSFCKVRILHYAAAKPVPISGILERLRGHGCSIAPATLNRILHRMNRNGWLESKWVPAGGLRQRRDYFLTPKGRAVLNLARRGLKELVAA